MGIFILFFSESPHTEPLK